MSLKPFEYNQKYTVELKSSFQKLDGFGDIENRLQYYEKEDQITDDLEQIERAVLDIYSSDEKVDWTLIKPLKQKLIQLEKSLGYFQKAQKSKQFVSNSQIHKMRELVSDIGNLVTRDGTPLKEKYSTGGYNQMKDITLSFIDNKVGKISDLIDGLWLSENKIGDLKKISDEFCKGCDEYIEKNKNIFLGLETKEQRLEFVLDCIKEIIENVIGPSKFKIIFGKKFDILDEIEEYSGMLYEIIKENDYSEQVRNFIEENFA